MGIELLLRCDECDAVSRPKIYQRWAPETCLEIAGETPFYVDGGSVRCPAHTDPAKARKQRQSKAVQREMEVPS
jgi:hypothetical protein